MTTSYRFPFLKIALVFVAVLLSESAHAQDVANLGNFNVGGRRLVYKNVLAIRGKSSGENRIIVLATSQPITAAVLKTVKDKDAEENVDGEVDQPYLKAVFREDGSLQSLTGKGNGNSFMQNGPPMEGKASIADGRIRGTAKLIQTGNFAKEVTLNFDVPIDAPMKVAGPAKLDPPVKATVSGKFLGDGKPSQIKFVSVEESEPFSGKEAITLVFTEKDHSAAKKPSFDAGFGKFGSALILRVHHDGGIFGCEVRHSAHSKAPFSALGQIHMVEFAITGGNVTGEVSTGGTLDTFGQKWEVDLKFAAPLPEKLRNAPAAPVAPEKPAASEPPDSTKKAPKATAGPQIAARKLALPKDATDVQYKQIVEHIQFSSRQSVDAVANEFSSRLKQQGWKESPGSLMGKTNAILKREQGDAKLTIMVQPAATGSVVKVFTEGLDWSGGDEGKPASPSKADTDADAVEQQAEKLINDALKNLPKGF
jgi:hypothetical protein